MDIGALTAKGLSTLNGGVVGASQEGWNYLSTYITTSTFDFEIPLDKDDYIWGMLIISPGYLITGSKGVTVIFTQETDEASAANTDHAYSKAYSKISPTNMLSSTIFSPAQSELKNVYIDNAVPAIHLDFTKTGGGTGAFYGNVWWRVFQG